MPNQLPGRRPIILLLFLSCFLGKPPPGNAGGSQTSTVVVTASISPSCTIGTAAIAFAAYDPINVNATEPDDKTGNIVIRCTKGAQGIAIGLGNGANNTGTQRRMVNTANTTTTLDYEVFKESSRTTMWGPGDGGLFRSGSDLDGTGSNITVTMFGRIPPRQLHATAGTYNDTLVSIILF